MTTSPVVMILVIGALAMDSMGLALGRKANPLFPAALALALGLQFI